MNYLEWEGSVPNSIKGDSLWKMEAYRIALFLSDIAWKDVSRLVKDRRTTEVSDQLYRATGSISSNISEGYSRSSAKDRMRFYEYSLGSARESRDWYFKSRFILGEKIVEHRLTFLASIIRLLLKMIPTQSDFVVRETAMEYGDKSDLEALLSIDVPEA